MRLLEVTVLAVMNLEIILPSERTIRSTRSLLFHVSSRNGCA